MKMRLPTRSRRCTCRPTGCAARCSRARRITLAGGGDDINDLDHPDRVAPVEDSLAVTGSEVELVLKPFSLMILRIKASR